MLRILLYIAVCGISFTSLGLDAKAELEKLAQTHQKLQSYKVGTTYRLYESHTSMNAIEVHKGLEYKHGKGSLSYLAGITTLYTKEDYLLIDSLEQQILLYKKPESIKDAQSVGLRLDSLQKSFSDIEVKELDKNLKVIILKTSRKRYSEMEKIMLYYDTAYRIKKIVLCYGYPADVKNQMKEGEKPRIEISYGAYVEKLDPSEIALLQKNHYLITQKGTLVGVGAYTSYEIIDGRYKK